MENKMHVGSKWKCIDKSSDVFNLNCTITYIDTNPDLNGDGTIELVYEDGLVFCGKVRRFIPNITHIYIKD